MSMEDAVVESAAQECAARIRSAPVRVNPICEFRLPAYSMIRKDQVEGVCVQRCKELASP